MGMANIAKCVGHRLEDSLGSLCMCYTGVSAQSPEPTANQIRETLVHFEVHKVLCLPRNLHFEVHKVGLTETSHLK